MIVSIYIGNDKLDLMAEENIIINSSVQNVNDITKNTTDFSQNFKLPASQTNNIIFKHYYNFNIDNGFDARTRQNARIEINNLVFRHGKISLLSVDVIEGRPKFYNIVFIGNLVNIKDKVKEDTLNDLDLSAYNHLYNSTNVKQGLTTFNLFSGSIIYPLLVKKRYYYNSLSTDNTYTESLANIAYNGGGLNGIKWSDLRPSIKIIRLIEAIETKYNITFTRDFFGRSEFTELYMWINRQRTGDNNKFKKRIDFNSGDSTWVDLGNDTGSFYSYRYENAGFFLWKYFTNVLTVTPDDLNQQYKIITYINGDVYSEETCTGVKVIPKGSFGYGFPPDSFTVKNYDIYFEIEAQDGFVFDAWWNNTEITKREIDGSIVSAVQRDTYATTQSIIGTFDVSDNLPNMKIIDFLKGLFQAFKLVVIQENNTDPIYVNTLNSFYSQGNVYDLTKYVDNEKINVERGTILNNIKYNFSEPQTILNKEFENNTGLGYGDLELILKDENGDLLEGESLEIELPFEQIVYERLTDINGGVNTSVMYGAIISETLEPINPKAHIHYNINNSIGTKTVSFVNDLGIEELLQFNINIPSHTRSLFNSDYSFIFGSEFSTYGGEIITNTLYKNYHENYINSIFNIKRRNIKVEAPRIPYNILLKLRLNDVIEISSDYFRINSFNTNLITGKVTLDLINSFDNNLNAFEADRSTIITDQTAKTESVFITNLNNFNLVFDFYGNPSWITYTSNSGNVFFNITFNNWGVVRTARALITSLETSQQVEITIIQEAGTITVDNTYITADNDIITVDNG